MDKSTDKLRDHVCVKGEGVKKFEIFMDVIDGSPLTLRALLLLRSLALDLYCRKSARFKADDVELTSNGWSYAFVLKLLSKLKVL